MCAYNCNVQWNCARTLKLLDILYTHIFHCNLHACSWPLGTQQIRMKQTPWHATDTFPCVSILQLYMKVVLHYILDINTSITVHFLTNRETQLSQPLESLVHTVNLKRTAGRNWYTSFRHLGTQLIHFSWPRDATDTRPYELHHHIPLHPNNPSHAHLPSGPSKMYH
jgi:hypothetical protein